MVRFSDLEEKLGIKFNNPKLLEEAFTHRSFLNERGRKGLVHNERLEFLGDAVLEIGVTEFLFHEFPQKPEGELTALRAALVNSGMLFEVAKKLGLENYIRLSKGEEKESGKGKHFILANSVEALIGAIYLDRGFDVSVEFIKKFVCDNLQMVLDNKLWQDAKSLFQEKAQEVTGFTPTYEVLEESGPDHKKHFTVGVYLDEEMVARGDGFSKQDAQRNAAEEALREKGWEE